MTPPRRATRRTVQPRGGAIAIRRANASDQDFILSLAPRFVAFDLPHGRGKRATLAAIRVDIQRALAASDGDHHFFVAEDAKGRNTGFVHLQVLRDFFSGKRACHISDLAVATGHDGHGIGRALLAFAQAWARDHACTWLSLAVFPGNTRARTLYERAGFTPELIRMSKPLRSRAQRRRT